ncbi:lysophospholipid acyltransferase family protein [Leeia oryzae]|uniref:lysophospholipid acyltransferase family protein n=1 Tax=Leeia oryzae TaxID=356662 RepID=UPI000377C088|nr:lysophospholipid acyltransferase family protein [Leeia oryzae]
MIRFLPRPLQVVLFYLMLVWLGSMLLAGNLVTLTLIGVPRSVREPIVQRCISLICRVFLDGCEHLGFMRLDLAALDRLNRREPVVLTPNHPSMIDAFLILSRVHSAVCLMKASISSNLFLGAGAYLAGYIPNRRPERMFRAAIRTVKSGTPLLIFPEGTRTTHPPVNAFQGAAALIARKANAPLQTIVITTDSPYLCKGWKLWRPPVFPLCYRVVPGPRILVDGSVDALTARLQAYFEAELSTTPAARQPGQRP